MLSPFLTYLIKATLYFFRISSSTKITEVDPATSEEVIREVKHIKQSTDGTTARYKDDMPLTAFELLLLLPLLSLQF